MSKSKTGDHDETTFDKDYRAIAEQAMAEVNPQLVVKFANVIECLAAKGARTSKLRGRSAPVVGSAEYFRHIAKNFASARHPRPPARPKTIPDTMVGVVLQHHFGLPAASIARTCDEHALSMGAENAVGDLLERYLAEVMEPMGWIWCSGSFVRAIDFIKPSATEPQNWALLQVKNRDNSENSSSSAIRDDTPILKWHRTFSKKAGTNWDAFPDERAKDLLSEAGFKRFVVAYLAKFRCDEA